ncbi:hypothetical protein B1813_08600 [Saccharomonospora piscinae]|uniref:DUF3558 domain-containing protein n=1 Tax=Saccharomonospora piscinae TaxID=687388 RepID=A0A1V9A5G6_SACPI|nr:hypothetical protein [Saccharomonospora piscinae]OQO92276.1 hypothetical protein B1813_08600 [Saccharomonospora piscinae]
MRRHWGFAAALLAAVVAGCGGSAVEGSPVPDGERPEPITVAALGDPRTLDPCSLAGLAAFAEHGGARPLARVSLDHCRMAVTVGSENVVVDFGMLSPPRQRAERGLATLPGEVRLVATSAQGRLPCSLDVVLADDVRVEVSADAQRSDSTLDSETVCAVARSAADGIHATLASGQAGHWEPPTHSLARLSACGLLPTDEVAAIVGTSSRVTLYPAEHQCTWGTPGGERPNAQLDFTVGPELGSRDGDEESLAGRDTVVHLARTDSVSVCTLSTEQGPFAEAIDGEREIAVVRVLLPGGGAEPCEAGRALAEAAWEKLPAAS